MTDPTLFHMLSVFRLRCFEKIFFVVDKAVKSHPENSSCAKSQHTLPSCRIRAKP